MHVGVGIMLVDVISARALEHVSTPFSATDAQCLSLYTTVSSHCSCPDGPPLSGLPTPTTAASASCIQSFTALLQSSAAEVIAGGSHTSPAAMMHGGTVSLQLFKQMLAGVRVCSQDRSATLDAQHRNS